MSRINKTFEKRGLTGKIYTADAYSDDNGKTWRWASNNSVIMIETCREYGIPCDEQAQQIAREVYVTAALDDYCQKQGPVTAEQRVEALAAYGPGKVVVDVISGRKFRT